MLHFSFFNFLYSHLLSASGINIVAKLVTSSPFRIIHPIYISGQIIETGEIHCLQEHLKQSDLSFIFRLQVFAKHSISLACSSEKLLTSCSSFQLDSDFSWAVHYYL